MGRRGGVGTVCGVPRFKNEFLFRPTVQCRVYTFVLYFGCIPSENKMSNADMCTLIQCHFKFPNVTTDTALYYSINYLSLFGSEISVKNIIIVSVYSVPTTLQYVQYLYFVE